jgi:uncharacterized protein (TIGR00725 family)
MAELSVALIGSAGKINIMQRDLALRIGEILGSHGYNLICGGLDGVMAAACEGFQSVECRGKTIGILPSYDVSTANQWIDIAIPTGLDVGRNQLVVASAFAVIVIGGGAGTLSEIALASQINKPILLLKGSGGWADKLEDDFLDQRKNTRIHHIQNPYNLTSLLKQLSQITDKGGVINSNHNR